MFAVLTRPGVLPPMTTAIPLVAVLRHQSGLRHGPDGPRRPQPTLAAHPDRTRAEIRRDYPALARAHAHRADAIIVPSAYTGGEVERAATLFGASDAARASIGAKRQPDHQILYDRWLARTLAHLDTETYSTHYENGRALTIDEACTLALGRNPALIS